jgi:hypothetical protein
VSEGEWRRICGGDFFWAKILEWVGFGNWGCGGLKICLTPEPGLGVLKGKIEICLTPQQFS